jgi:parvulin-like peptidyl-prolyl isomerase
MARFPFIFKKSEHKFEDKPSHKEFNKKHLARVEREKRQRKWLLGGLIVIGIAVLGLIGYGLLDQFVLRDLKPVAEVNDEKITAKEFVKRVQYVRAQLGQQYLQYVQYYQWFGSDPTFSSQIQSSLQQLETQLSPSYASTLAQTVLDRMMEERLIMQLAQKEGITVSDKEVDAAMQEAFGFFPNGTPVPTATSTTFPTATLNPAVFDIITATPTSLPPTITPTPIFTLTPVPSSTPTATVDPAIPTNTPAPTSTPMTEEGYATKVSDYVSSAADYGFTVEDFRYMYLVQLTEIKLKEKITANESPVQEQVWARHILVSDEATANDLISQLMEGADFAELAKQYSLDTSNASNGGDLGWFSKGAMVKEFEDAAFALKPGDISAPVQTSFGWHLIQCIDHTTRTLTESEFNTFKTNAYNKWLDEQKTSASKYEMLDYWQTVVPTEPGVPVVQ